MSFIYPYFLFALIALSIPILIHLLNFKSFKVVYFSNVRFLQNVQKETRSRSNLKHWLILLMRLLTITCLVFAFSQPFIPISNQKKLDKKDFTIFLYIDNSFSMNLEGENGSLLEMAKNKARSIVMAYDNNTKFMLISNDFKSTELHLMNKDQTLESIGKLIVSPQTRALQSVINRQSDFTNNSFSDSMLNSTNHYNFYLISDFQKSTSNIKNIKPINDLSYFLVPIQASNTKNLYIDSIWFEVPVRKIDQNEQLTVRIRNTSKESYNNLPIKLYLNDTVKSISNFSIDGYSKTELQINFTNSKTGNINGRVEISDYPIVHDNSYFFSYSIDSKIKLLYIGKQTSNPYFKALFGQDNYVSLSETELKSVKNSELKTYRSIIIDQCEELPSAFIQSILQFAQSGGSVILVPSFKVNTSIYNALLSSIGSDIFSKLDTNRILLSEINLKSELFLNAFTKIDNDAKLPVIQKHLKTQKSNKSTNQSIFKAQNNDELLSSITYGKGRFYVFSFSLETQSSDFGEHPLIVPTFYNMVLNSQVSKQIAYTIGKDETIELQGVQSNDRNMLHLHDRDKTVDFIPLHFFDLLNSTLKINISGNIKKAGLFYIENKDSIVKNVSFNYNRIESELVCYLKDSLIAFANKSKDISVLAFNDDILTSKIKEQSQGRKLWNYFIILALLFLALETILVRYFDQMKKKR